MPLRFLVVLIVFALCIFAEAQQPANLPRVGFLSGPPLSSITFKPRIEAFRQSLRDLKYIEGQNISIEWRSADGVDERLPKTSTFNCSSSAASSSLRAARDRPVPRRKQLLRFPS